MPAPAPVDLRTAPSILCLSHKYDVHNPDVHLRPIAPSSPINALSVIAAATEVDASWLLPYAYYCAPTFSRDALLAASTADTMPYVQTCLLSHASILRATISANQLLASKCSKEVCRDAHVSRLDRSSPGKHTG
ncbi:hypothetical protein R3P38DRAFT_3202964 [Favolaschia claudopus]|uniref:Uncharacterized protein n=1 Tax=Favolaschia claudopus TaxID=2862362 RepID=A0AAW0AUC4_9AGAR